MNRLLVIALIFVGLATPAIASAAPQWGGVQLQAVIGGEHTFTPTVGVRGSASFFMIPTKDVFLPFIYVGPTFVADNKTNAARRLDSGVWISPQLVVAPRWFASPDGMDRADGVGPSLWVSITLGKVSIFLEPEVYFNVDRLPGMAAANYFGYYEVAVNPTDWFSVGGHVEQVDLAFAAGPHVGFKKGPMGLQVQYLFSATEHAPRFVFSLNF